MVINVNTNNRENLGKFTAYKKKENFFKLFQKIKIIAVNYIGII